MNVAVYVFAATPLPTGTTAVCTSALAAAYDTSPHDSATRRASGATSDAAPPFTSGSVATKVTAAVSLCRTTGPSSGLDEDTNAEVITGGLRSTYTRSSHCVTVATPPSTSIAPAGGGARRDVELDRHVVPTSPRHAVEVTSESFQFTDAPSTNPRVVRGGGVRGDDARHRDLAVCHVRIAGAEDDGDVRAVVGGGDAGDGRRRHFQRGGRLQGQRERVARAAAMSSSALSKK